MVHDGADVPAGPASLDSVHVRFDEQRLVSDAWLLIAATLAERLGIEALAGRLVRVGRGRPGAANAGRKVMALVFAMVLGADSIDDCEVLRAGKTRRLLGEWIPAPSTLGTFLRAVHLRACAPAGCAARRVTGACLAGWRGPRREQVGDRCRQLHRGGVRALEAGRRLRVHQAVGVSPDPRHARWNGCRAFPWRFSGRSRAAISRSSTIDGSGSSNQQTKAFLAIQSDSTRSPSQNIRRFPLPTRWSRIPSRGGSPA